MNRSKQCETRDEALYIAGSLPLTMQVRTPLCSSAA
jgi:hypothetical protein